MSQERRLVLLAPWPPPYGGVSVHVERLRDLLTDRGYSPHVLTFASGAASYGVEQLRLGRPYWPAHLATLARVVGRGGILHNHYASLTMYPAAGEDANTRRVVEGLLSFTKLWGIRWVETIHDQTIIQRYPGASPETRRLFNRALSTAAIVIAIGNPLREFLLDLGVPSAKVVVGSPLLPSRKVAYPLAVRYGAFFADHAPVWTTVGAFIPLYDFKTVATAFRRFLETQPRAGLVIVSGRFADDPSYRDGVLSLLADVPNSVSFVEDVPNDEVIGLLGASNLMVRGPQHESFGLTRVEALLAGTPVVATDTGETRFMTLYSHGDVESLLDAATRAHGAEAASGAAAYYREMARNSLQVILDVYGQLGARGSDPGSGE